MFINLSKTFSGLCITAALLIALGLIFYYNNNFYKESLRDTNYITSSPLPAKPLVPKNAWIELALGGDKKRLFAGDMGENTYSLTAALDSVAQAGGFAIKVRSGKISYLAGSNGSWKIYKNGQIINAPVDKLTIAAGDKYVLRIEK